MQTLKPSSIPEYNPEQNQPETLQPNNPETDQQQPENNGGILGTDDFDREFLQPRKMSTDSVVSENGIQAIPQAPAAAEAPPMSLDQATRNTEILLDARDTVQAFGISYYADGDLKHAEQYSYQEWQKQRLIKAWTPIIQRLNLNVSPWLDVIIAEAVCTAPMIGLAANNRKLRLENEKMAAKIAKMEKEAAQQGAARMPDTRGDGKNVWTVDADGYFTYNAKGKYLKKEDRHEKPTLNEHTYELLIKHNGKEAIDKIFKIQS